MPLVVSVTIQAAGCPFHYDIQSVPGGAECVDTTFDNMTHNARRRDGQVLERAGLLLCAVWWENGYAACPDLAMRRWPRMTATDSAV